MVLNACHTCIQKTGDTAIMLCAKRCDERSPNHKLAMALLLRHGAKTDAKNNYLEAAALGS